MSKLLPNSIVRSLLVFTSLVMTAIIIPSNIFAVPPGPGFDEDTGGIGTINPHAGTVPDVGGDPSSFVAGLVSGALSFLLIAAFILALLWTVFAGFRFIFAGGESKNISSAWSQIYWGLLGMAIVLGAFAIIKLVETFFGVIIISGPFQLPTGAP